MGKYQCLDIINEYNRYMYIKTKNEDEFWAMGGLGRIGIPESAINSSHPLDIFRLLHEIGHCETYQLKHTKATREFEATQWAINHSKKYNVNISKQNKTIFQDYIYSFSKAKNKEIKYKLNWDMKGE